MNWKIFIAAFANLSAICLPYNIIGCASDGVDPHDYFVSFFDKNLSPEATLKPFYYTNYQFLYDEQETADVSKLTSADWISYTGNTASADEAYNFICRFSPADLIKYLVRLLLLTESAIVNEIFLSMC